MSMKVLIAKLKDKPYIRPLLQIHDELLFEVDDGYETEAIDIIRTAMERVPFVGFDIPIVAEGEHGKCFGTTKSAGMTQELHEASRLKKRVRFFTAELEEIK